MASDVLTRVVRRETHSPRTIAAVVVLALVAISAVYVGIEIVLRLAGRAPLFVGPGQALAWLRDLPAAQPQAGVVAGGIVIALIGVLLMWLALGRGRRPKHELGVSSHAVIVDNGVIASAVAERVRRELDLSKGAVVVGIGHRNADITVRPEPGQTVAKEQARTAAEAELSSYNLVPTVKVRARVIHTADEEVMK